MRRAGRGGGLGGRGRKKRSGLTGIERFEGTEVAPLVRVPFEVPFTVAMLTV